MPEPTRPPTFWVLADPSTPAETTDLLLAACAARAVPCEVITPSQVRPEGRLRRGDALLTVGVSRAAQVVEAQLFSSGVATVFVDEAHGPLRDVVAPDVVLQRAGVPMPRGAWVVDADPGRLRALVAHLGGLPVVLRLDGGEGGVGVMRLDSWPSLISVVDHVCASGQVPRLLTYVEAATHWRLVVVGQAVVAAYPNPTQPDDFRSVPSADPAAYRATAPEASWAEVAVRAVAALGVAFGGVDLLVHPSGRVYVLEVNTPCYFPQAQVVGGVDVAGPLVEWLWARARRLAGDGAPMVVDDQGRFG